MLTTAVPAALSGVAAAAQLPAFQLLTVLLAFVGAGLALAAGIGLVAVYGRLGDGVPGAVTRRAFGLWAVGALLLAAGTPAAFRGSLAATPTLRGLGVVAVALGVLGVALAPAYLWRTTVTEW